MLIDVLALLGYVDRAIALFQDLPLASEQTRLQWEAKLFLPIVILFIGAR